MCETAANPANVDAAPGAVPAPALRARAAGTGAAVVPLAAAGSGLAALVARGQLVGVVTDGALRCQINRRVHNCAAAIANRDAAPLTANRLAAGALARRARRSGRRPMLSGAADRSVRVVHLHDIPRAGGV